MAIRLGIIIQVTSYSSVRVEVLAKKGGVGTGEVPEICFDDR
jgi:hypothetical protein